MSDANRTEFIEPISRGSDHCPRKRRRHRLTNLLKDHISRVQRLFSVPSPLVPFLPPLAGSLRRHGMGYLVDVKNNNHRVSVFSSSPQGALAEQHGGTAKEEKACIRDVMHFCRKLINQGDFTILACLKQNRALLKPACRKLLGDHGQ